MEFRKISIRPWITGCNRYSSSAVIGKFLCPISSIISGLFCLRFHELFSCTISLQLGKIYIFELISVACVFRMVLRTLQTAPFVVPCVFINHKINYPWPKLGLHGVEPYRQTCLEIQCFVLKAMEYPDRREYFLRFYYSRCISWRFVQCNVPL